jgi:hypothetical protein
VVPTLQLLRGEIQSKIERPVLSHPYEQEKGDDAPFPENLERGGRNARRNAMGYEADMTDVHRSLGNTRWATIVGLHTDKVEQPPHHPWVPEKPIKHALDFHAHQSGPGTLNRQIFYKAYICTVFSSMPQTLHHHFAVEVLSKMRCNICSIFITPTRLLL